MPSCEKCWKDSCGHPDRYAELLKERAAPNYCTPEEQAGDLASMCPRCKRKAIHQYAGACMTPGCDERIPTVLQAREENLGDELDGGNKIR